MTGAPRRLTALLAAAALALTLTPAAAADDAVRAVDNAVRERASAPKAAAPRPIVPEETSPRFVRRRKTDTLSLYQQAGLRPGRRVQRLIADEVGADGAAELAAYVQNTTRDGAGNVVPPGLRSHVDQYCAGTGTDGERVQVMYVREVDQPDRYAEVAPILRNEMRYIDDAFAVASLETGGGKRVRWVTDGSCNPSVLDVVLPDGAITGSLGTTTSALDAAGYLQSGRKYLAFADTPMGGLGGMACGQGVLYPDTSPTDNPNDGRYPQTARVDLECWVTNAQYHATPLHELLHTLGAVQPEAPHGSPGAHCSDGTETMCYNDGTVTVTEVCADNQHDIDCNKDDYFNTDPVPGSYLATHWNVANSPFLADVPRLADPPSLRVTPSTTTAVAGDVVTFTADVPAGAEVTWSTDSPWCETDAAATGTTYDVQCWDTFAPTVTATASYPSGYTTSTVHTTVSYSQGLYPTLVLNVPAQAPAGREFGLEVNVGNAEGTWSFAWAARDSSCRILTGAETGSATAVCDAAMQGKYAYFTATATRSEDGTSISDTAAVSVVGAGTPTTVVDGPTSVVAGTQATFTAVVSNVEDPTYQWYSARGWGESSGPAVTVMVPETATGSDTLYLVVRSASGEQVTVEHTYDVSPAFSMTMTGPDDLVAGQPGTFAVTPSEPAQVTWSTDRAACLVTPTADPTRALLSCADGFDGLVRITAVGRTATATRTVTRTVSVTPEPTVVVPRTDSRVALTASRGYPTAFTISLTDESGRPVPGGAVALERRSADGEFLHVRMAGLDSEGRTKFAMSVRRATVYRARFVGNATYAPSISAERKVSVFTRVKHSATARGLKAVLQTGWGRGVARKPLVLQRRTVGTRRWVAVRTYRTSLKGLVTLRIDPPKRTDYRWVFRGDAGFQGSRSVAVRKR